LINDDTQIFPSRGIAFKYINGRNWHRQFIWGKEWYPKAADRWDRNSSNDRNLLERKCLSKVGTFFLFYLWGF